VTALSPTAAYRLWSATYDSDPNPLLALEHRVLRRRLALTPATRVLDLATGTGRWLDYALSHGAHGVGVDLSAEMLAKAANKPGMGGRLVQATISALPFSDNWADLAICSFALGYVASLDLAFREMARTAKRVIVSDLHPEAVRAGWVRSFRAGGRRYDIVNHSHSRSVLSESSRAAGLLPSWSLEASFEEPEREMFERAGKGDAFEAATRIPAILISCWERR
jgi:ubiquinone/menaquinone biosynthesis C-methylase UbiE